jgi:ECF sigma factor.
MPSVSPQHVTQLLSDWSHGDDAALAELTPLVYEELRRLAHHFMEGQRPEHTLQTTALVNEAYLRLAGQTHPSFTNRSHFFRRRRASDASNPGQLCQGVSVPKTRWRRAQSRSGRGRADLARTDNRDSRCA